MALEKSANRFLDTFSRLRWRLTLSFSLVTLAAIFMVAWWSFLAVSLYLSQTLPESSLVEVRGEILNTLLSFIFPAVAVLAIPALLVGTLFGFITARWLERRLERLREATDAWSEGQFDARYHDEANDEISRFGRQLNHVAAELEGLLHTRQELAALEERNQLARDLHDSVKQQLTAATLQISTAEALIEQNPRAARNALVEAERLAIQAQQELTTIILELRPAALHDKGLPEALQHYLDQWVVQTGIQANFSTSPISDLPFNLELTLFRVAQEALANVTRHSAAGRVTVQLIATTGQITLNIRDDGRGFHPAAIQDSGFGLKSMRERVTQLNGSLSVISTPGSGTEVRAVLPLDSLLAAEGKTG